jgi:hypothetical protein
MVRSKVTGIHVFLGQFGQNVKQCGVKFEAFTVNKCPSILLGYQLGRRWLKNQCDIQTCSVSIIWVDLGKQNGGCTKHTFCCRSDGENKPLETCMSKSLRRKIINITIMLCQVVLKIVNNYKHDTGATGSLVLWATSVFYGWSIYGLFYPHGIHTVKGS